MFWKKSGAEKLPGPRPLPGVVQNYLTGNMKLDATLVTILKGVTRRASEDKTFDIRIFDECEASARKITVENYTSLDQYPDLVLYEGQFDEGSKQVKLEEKKKVDWETTIFEGPEILRKIEALDQPGSTIFFYLGAGPTYGGPLGRGAAVVELNPAYPGKKEKKYILYTADVVDCQPVGKGQKLLGSDKAKELAEWIKHAHHKRMY